MELHHEGCSKTTALKDTEDKITMRYLAVIETQKTKSYLFASPFMRETRGASVLLDFLNRKKTMDILHDGDFSGYEKIFLGGGSGRIIFEKNEDAMKFKKKVLDLYREKTVDARVSVEIVERKPNELFSEWMRRGVMMSQQNKLGRSEGIPVVAGRWVRPCTSCGHAPAEHGYFEHGDHYLCRSCLLKREEVRKLYKKIKPKEDGSRPLRSASELKNLYTNDFILTTFVQYNSRKDLDGGGTEYGLFLPQDFDDIGKHSKPSNYMGFIYADGNSMGEVVKKLGKSFPDDEEAKQAYKAFSEIVDRATREAAVESVMEVVDWMDDNKKQSRFVPAEFILAGGDDLMLAVPADKALDVGILFIDKFQNKTRELQCEYVDKGKLSKCFSKQGLTTSAGVVIAHTHYPISDLMTLAADLMKIAKKQAAALSAVPAADDTQKSEGTLDFIVLNKAGSEPIKKRRKREYEAESPHWSLTERPYTTDKARVMLDTIRELKRSAAPRSKLKALYSSLFKSPMQAQFDALRIKERLQVTGNLESDSALAKLFVGLTHFPFRIQDDHSWSTPLTEIIELYDFVQNEDSSGDEAGTP